jgi:predicted dehydrogenase
MAEPIKVAMIGLDTSHCVEFVRRMQDPECPYTQVVDGLETVTCLRFKTPFVTDEVLNERQAILEKLGVRVTTNFEEAVADGEAIMIELNDPALHREYVEKCISLGRPIFLDKPLADSLENGRAILQLAKEHRCKVFSASSLRFAPALRKAHATIPQPVVCHVFGAYGQAPVGSSIVWYGVHAFEMLQATLGSGALTVEVHKDRQGLIALVTYADGRRGTVELTSGAYNYGGYIMNKLQAYPFVVDGQTLYTYLLREVEKYFRGTPAPLSLFYDTLAIMALLETAEKSFSSGKAEPVPTL